MAFGQYSTSKQIIQEEDNNTQGSSSFSSWNQQIQVMKSQPRKRALGRVTKTLAVSFLFCVIFILIYSYKIIVTIYYMIFIFIITQI